MKTTVVTAAIAAIVTSPALAVDVFTDLSLWNATVGSPTLDDLASYGEQDLVLGTNGFFDGYSVDLAGSSTGSTNVNGATNLVFTLNGGLDSLTFTWDTPQDGVGFTILNSFVSNGLTIEINGESFNVEDFYDAANFDFLGFADAGGITSATFTATDPAGGTEFAAISEVYSSKIPAPSTAALLGLGGLAAARRRR